MEVSSIVLGFDYSKGNKELYPKNAESVTIRQYWKMTQQDIRC
ncbi:hypothetical protein HanXRQr2_Chr09g0400511 [Helianthus annuus]|uniref:Uncharacterized protein n=1 Tax=Helianthus annuus TaxID=4232 RepID=A0A9K3N9T6_HELAN|nr:hypothetical protein HanXRQr2_Chr09g0400511 [Helianthus annuus]KAJ0894191.1 hypothetical protein HanPSC8_Chr09g0386281 [Helianthus annuus]